MLTRWQALEYITAQNLERRALATLGCITVVPGAVGAWRREAIVKLGGFPSNTLAEDQDLTIMVQRAGYKVLFDQEAIAWTEAPDTHRGSCEAAVPLGLRHAAMPLEASAREPQSALRSAWPRCDAAGLAVPDRACACVAAHRPRALLFQILRTLADYLQHGEQFNSSNLMITATYYAVFMTVDLTAAAIAFFLEKEGGPLAVVVARPAAVRLPADHVLCGREICAEGLARPRRRLGQARA